MAIKTILRWSNDNGKVQKLRTKYKKILSFGLPAFQSADGFKVCPGAGACAAVCYARQGTYRFGSVIRAREHNLRFARGNKRSFSRAIEHDLKLMKPDLVRLHDSGDWFDAGYQHAWFRAIRKFPGIKFYCYTKSLHLDWSDKPENLSVTFSEGGIWDAEIDMSQSHARIFSSHDARKEAGYKDGNKSDYLAVIGKPGEKIGLVYHGVKNMTDAQEKHFS